MSARASEAPEAVDLRADREASARVATEGALATGAVALVALHVADDNFLQPNPGTGAADHLVSGLPPIAALVGIAAIYARVRAGARATIALQLGFFGVLAGVEALYYTRAVDPGGTTSRACSRCPPACCSLALKGWYIPSRNRAAVIVSPGRSGTQSEAKMLARHGYGAPLLDRRGEGESEGDPNVFGWQGERDIHAAVAFLQGRSDVDPERIGGIGLSVGGEMMIAAAAGSSALKAIVSEGASGRSVRDILANPGDSWQEVIGNSVATAATAVFTNNLPPADLRSLVPKIAPRAVFFIYGERGQPAEEPANKAFYEDAGGPKKIWEVPEAGHVGGLEARPETSAARSVSSTTPLLETK